MKIYPQKLLGNIPTFLIGLRFALGPLIWWSMYNKMAAGWFLAGFILAYLTDIFDGIIARRLQVDTPALRTADSWVDTWLYFWVVSSIWITHLDSLKRFGIPILILIALQSSEWVYGRIKFGRWTGYHAYTAKLWGISLFMAIFSVMFFKYDGMVWWLAIIIGWISSLENWLLTLTLSTWRTDVKSIFHIWQMNNTSS